MRKGGSVFIVVLTVAYLFGSCGVNSNLMFKEAKNAPKRDSIPLKPLADYKISKDDKITFSLATKDGARIIEEMSGISEESKASGGVAEFLVRSNGEVKLPIVGNVRVAGLTIPECEDTLERLYSKEYKEPFVQVKVTNQRVIVFPGNGSDAKVIPLANSNTTLMEALAQAGGITDRGKASAIKIIRNENGERVVYTIDLSTMEGLKYVDLIVQANDYIYVEPTPELSKEFADKIVPLVSLISSALFIVSAVLLIK